MAGLGFLSRVELGWHAVVFSLAAAACLFTILMLCHTQGFIGGGDVKLLCSLAVGLSPLNCYYLVGSTALSGGLLATVYIVLQRLLPKARSLQVGRSCTLRRVVVVEAWRIRRRGPLPYGIAIALGGAFVLLQLPGV